MDPDPEPHLWLTDSDPGGPKHSYKQEVSEVLACTSGSPAGGGGGTLTDIGEELLELLRLLVEPVLVAHEGEELSLELGVQAGDHQLHRVPDLPHTLILRLKQGWH